MNSSGRTIAKNASVLMASQLITWGLTFLLTIFMPRRLGPVGMGQLELGNALWGILAVVAALGTDTLITKEVARTPSKLGELFGITMTIRVLFFIFGALGMIFYVLMIGYPDDTQNVIFIIGFCFLIGQFSSTYDSSLKGLERMEYTSLASIVFVGILSFLRIGLLFLGYGVVAMAVVGIFANAAVLAIDSYFLHRLYNFKLSVNWRLIGAVLKGGLPYFLVSVGIILYHKVDTIIISLLVDEKTIGWYGVADHLFGTLLFIPNVFMMALFPSLSRAYAGSTTASPKLAQKSINLLLLVGVPIGLGILVISDQLVILLFGSAFANSGPVLGIRGVLLILTYVNMLLGFLLISMDRQKIWAVVILIATFATIPLDLILVPWTVETFANGALGGALSYAFTEIGMTVVAIALLPKGFFNMESIKVASKTLFAGGVMVGITWIWRNYFILIPIFVGAVTYIGMTILLHIISKEDWDFFFGIGSAFIRRIRNRFSRAAELKG